MNDIHVILADLPGLGQVRLCPCNSVYVSVGPVTIHLEPAAFEQMAQLVASAKKELAKIKDCCNEEHGPVLLPRPQKQTTH
jgi:hypothetical protein